VRLFVGIWPTDQVLDEVAALPRVGDARWTRRDQWHVTLHFIGEVDSPEPWIERVQEVASRFAPRTVTLGPATKILGKEVLMIPAAGLDDVAAGFSDEKFRGHLTLARRATRDLAGASFSAAFEAREIALIRSHLGDVPARYETIAVGAFAP
jgi:2'-5' RNA ligase